MKQLLFIFMSFFSITSCNVYSENNDDEIMRLLKVNSNLYLKSYEFIKLPGIKEHQKTIKIRDACFKNENVVMKLPNKEALLLINHAINRGLDKGRLAILTGCFSDKFDNKNLELFYQIMRRSISSNNIVSFQFFFSKYYQGFRPNHKEAFYLLEIAIEYCAVDFIDFLMELNYPLNNKIWGSQKKFQAYYKLVCEFNESTILKLDEYYEKSTRLDSD